jgi:hypothetical protein
MASDLGSHGVLDTRSGDGGSEEQASTLRPPPIHLSTPNPAFPATPSALYVSYHLSLFEFAVGDIYGAGGRRRGRC